MWPYYVMYLVPAFLAVIGDRRALGRPGRSPRLDLTWIGVIFLLTLLIGLRYDVGGDWGNYMRHVLAASEVTLSEALQGKDPAYQLFNWYSVDLGLGVFGTNLAGGFIFSVGLAVFCRSLPRPWLALATAMPYLVIVVAMGYSRQAIALGLAMLGLEALGRGSVLRFTIFIVIGATFHKSAVLLLPIAALASTRNRYWTAAWIGVVAIGAYFLLLEEVVDELYTNYIEAQYQSQGAMIRLIMNSVPAVLLLAAYRRFNFTPQQASLWRWFALISLALLGVLAMTSASTAVDRMALYMLPLQLVVFSHAPGTIGGRRQTQLVLLGVLAYYAAVLHVWLNYASHSYAWLPYRMLLPDAL